MPVDMTVAASVRRRWARVKIVQNGGGTAPARRASRYTPDSGTRRRMNSTSTAGTMPMAKNTRQPMDSGNRADMTGRRPTDTA